MRVLIKPVVTEKSMGKISEGKYVFVVSQRANKVQIARAIEDLYQVKVEQVNIVIAKGEEKLVRGRFKSKISPFKKAIVTLKKGEKIPGFEEK